MQQNPPVLPPAAMLPSRNPSVIQQGVVDVSPSILASADALIPSSNQAQGNPQAAANIQPNLAQQAPMVMTLEQLQHFVMQQCQRLQYLRRPDQQGPSSSR